MKTSLRRTSHFTIFPILFLLLAGFAKAATACPQQVTQSEAKLLEQFKDAFKLASQGKPKQYDSIQEDVEDVAKQQLESFVETLAKGDDDSKEIAERLSSSMEFVEVLNQVLQYELENEPMPNMEAISFRDTLDELGIHMSVDLRFVVGAAPAERKMVRICLPDLHACGGCKVKLEKALVEIEGFEEAIVNLETLTAQFLAPAETDVEPALDELEKTVNQLKNWKMVR